MNADVASAQTREVSDITEQDAALARRTSWGAIWAGFFVALAAEFVLTILMVGIFASFVHPGGGSPSGLSFGIGIAIWFFLQTIGSYYLGGWVCGRLARKPDGWWNAVHALAVWGITTAVMVYLLVGAAGSAVSGTLDLVRSGLGIATNAAQAVGPAAANAAAQQHNVGSAVAAAGNAVKGAGTVAVAIATWIPIFLFITFGVSLGTALLGGLAGTPGTTRSDYRQTRVTRGTAT